jgi:hypothetical protein
VLKWWRWKDDRHGGLPLLVSAAAATTHRPDSAHQAGAIRAYTPRKHHTARRSFNRSTPRTAPAPATSACDLIFVTGCGSIMASSHDTKNQ